MLRVGRDRPPGRPHRQDRDARDAGVARVRRDGFALIDQELEIGLRSIAVPLENARGRVVAALNIGAPAALASARDMVTRYLPEMRAVQAALRPVLA